MENLEKLVVSCLVTAGVLSFGTNYLMSRYANFSGSFCHTRLNYSNCAFFAELFSARANKFSLLVAVQLVVTMRVH